MATTGLRRVLPRLLPALLFALLAVFAAPQPAVVSPQATVVCAVAAFAFVACALVARAYGILDVLREPPDRGSGAEPPPAGRITVLVAQSAAGVRGSRAPPAASV